MLRSYQRISPGPRCFETFRKNKKFLLWGSLSPTPTPKLVDSPLSAVRDCLFNIFVATFRNGGLPSICKMSMHHSLLTRTKPIGDKVLRVVCTEITPADNTDIFSVSWTLVGRCFSSCFPLKVPAFWCNVSHKTLGLGLRRGSRPSCESRLSDSLSV
jgi:hypothetical protein